MYRFLLNFFPTLQLHCPCLSVVFPLHDSRLTLIVQLDGTKKLDRSHRYERALARDMFQNIIPFSQSNILMCTHWTNRLWRLPIHIFSSLELYCSRLSVVLISYDSRSTLLWLDGLEKFGRVKFEMMVPKQIMSSFLLNNFFQRSRRIRVNPLSYESQTTDKQVQYHWRAEKIWTVTQR